MRTPAKTSVATINADAFCDAVAKIAGACPTDELVSLRLDADRLSMAGVGTQAVYNLDAGEAVIHHDVKAVVRLADLEVAASAVEDKGDFVLRYLGAGSHVEIGLTEIGPAVALLPQARIGEVPAETVATKPDRKPRKKAARVIQDAPPAVTPSDSPSAPAIAADTSDAPPIIGWTAAPEDYDGFGTTTIDPAAGVDDRKRVIRKVAIQPEHFDWQTQRYGSGMHVFCTPAGVDRMAGGKYPVWTIDELAPRPEPRPSRVHQHAAPAVAANGEIPDAEPCVRCGTTKGWRDKGRYIRMAGGYCKKCYFNHIRPGAGGTGAPRQPREPRVSRPSVGNGFVMVGDQLINTATITHLRFNGRLTAIRFVGQAEELILEGTDALVAWQFLGAGAANRTIEPDAE